MPEVSIYSLLPDPAALLAMEPEELAGVVLQHLNSVPDESAGRLNRHNFGLEHTVAQYPAEFQDSISRALMEAWVWLEREGLIAPRPGVQGDWVFITRRGRQLTTPGELASYRRGNLLPRQLLHPRIAQRVWATFLRGSYDTAVFEAFKEIEVAVRGASGLPASDFGVVLMRKAFEKNSGPLADLNALPAEREALASLFVGAIGSYKNPHSHRHVDIEATEAVEMIILASHLLRIVERRQGISGDSPVDVPSV